jgi:hypothetical protein
MISSSGAVLFTTSMAAALVAAPNALVTTTE